MLLKVSQNSQENIFSKVSFFNIVESEACNFIKKETLAQVFAYELCEILKNTSFIENLSVNASAMYITP